VVFSTINSVEDYSCRSVHSSAVTLCVHTLLYSTVRFVVLSTKNAVEG
jgi:hypothetical protein